MNTSENSLFESAPVSKAFFALANRFLLPFGNDKIAAFGISSKINMIATMIVVGFSYGAQPLIGYNYGQKNFGLSGCYFHHTDG